MLVNSDLNSRQHLSISLLTLDTLEEDLVNYFDEKATIGTIINQIVLNHRPMDIAQDYPKTERQSFKIYLNKAVKDILSEIEYDDLEYNNIGRYIRTVIEEYIRMPIYKRERILFKDEIDRYNIELESEDRCILLLKSGGMQFDFKIYRISEEGESNYNYLIGLSRRHGTNDKYVPASFRLSRVTFVKRLSRKTYGSGKISKENRIAIDKKLKFSGVDFLVGDIYKI